VFSQCHYCVCLCGTEITVRDNKVLSIQPDRRNPYTWKDFCRKGLTAAEVVDHPQRLLTPMRRVGDHYVPASYDEAIQDISRRLNAIIERDGADAVATYHGNPLGFNLGGMMFFAGLQDALGTGNRFAVGSVDQNNVHVVQKAMYGYDMIGLLPDIEECGFFLLIGMDPSQSKYGWVDTIPDGWARTLEAQSRGAKIIVVDPRLSETAKRADVHVAIRPGTDWALLLGMLAVIFAEELDRAPEAIPTTGIDAVRALAAEAELANLAEICGLREAEITCIARDFASAATAAALTHTGVAHTAAGAVGEWLCNLLNIVTNRIDVVGGRRFERGYTNLPLIMKSLLKESTHHTRLRGRPAVAGCHALAELADEITTPGKGQIRALIIANGNPVVSGPDGAALDAALQDLELLVAVDLVQRESHCHADWLIPGTHFLEREGLHVLFSGLMDKPFAQFANRAVTPPPGVQEEWEFFANLAIAMKRPLFGHMAINHIVRSTRWLAVKLRRPGLAFSPRVIERLLVLVGRRVSMKKIKSNPHGILYDDKVYGDLRRMLLTPDKTVHCAPPELVAACRALLGEPVAVDDRFPLTMINRRSRESMNSWLNETGGLFQSERFNSVEIHRQLADELGITDGQRVRVRSAIGSIILPARIVEGARPDVVVVPHGWGSRVFDPRSGAAAADMGVNRNLLVDRTVLDPLSHVPAFNTAAVRIELVPDQAGGE
jgi:formate dehydrogenase